MGWTESPSYFCAASETARDIAEEYAKADKLDKHYLEEWTKLKPEFQNLPSGELSLHLAHCFEVYVDDFIAAAIQRTKEDLTHHHEPFSTPSTMCSRQAPSHLRTTRHH